MLRKFLFLLALPASILLAVNSVAKADVPMMIAEFAEKPNLPQLITQSTNRRCPASYAKTAFRGRTGRIAFFNQWTTPVTVVIYHPTNGRIFSRYTVPPRQNHILVNGFVGDDWGVCFENLPNPTGFVNNLGQISEYNPNWQGSPLFMIQNPRIMW